jgi:heme exporter protein B
MNYLNHLWRHLQKDLRIEWRSRDAINGMLFYALLVVFVFSLAFDPTANPALARTIAGGVLWVAILFAATTTLNQTWTREQRNAVLEAQRMAPAPASALFLGKVLANLLFVGLIEAVLAPVFVIFYNLHPLGETRLLFLVMPLGTWALLCNGTFFAALGLRTRNRELMLPLILIPISLPALLGMINATAGVLTGDEGFNPHLWIRMLAGYDIIFTIICLFLFETVLTAE